jgi:hypothetical protein
MDEPVTASWNWPIQPLGYFLPEGVALRWTAAGMLEATKGFRCLKAYKHLSALRAALIAHDAKHVVTCQARRCTTGCTVPTPHSIVPGDACFAYFNKVWGNPLDDDVLHCHHDL